ncbi:hypothetical protein [Spirochaeta cellobiosiphila]|uniref:hypothetical protein n=1 Tax=Spirochaeta cellobiosiphila TaxID=504483 RepID=UPI0003F68FE4|nr:hypothetical protein [Spirochaeta cellobiosiphila]
MIDSHISGVLAGHWIGLCLQPHSTSWEDVHLLLKDPSHYPLTNPLMKGDFLHWLDHDNRLRTYFGFYLLKNSLVIKPSDMEILLGHSYMKNEDFYNYRMDLEKKTLQGLHNKIIKLVKKHGGDKLLDRPEEKKMLKKHLRVQNKLLVKVASLSMEHDDKKITSLVDITKSELREAIITINNYYSMSPGV